jgi:hypothetical protein
MFKNASLKIVPCYTDPYWEAIQIICSGFQKASYEFKLLSDAETA